MSASLSTVQNGTLYVEEGSSVQIPLNVSAGQTWQSVINRIDRSPIISNIVVGSDSINISQAVIGNNGTYNVSVSNLAGSTSFIVNIIVQGKSEVI